MKHQPIFKPPNHRNPPLWSHYVLICLVSATCYFNGLEGEFVHDDIPAIVMNKDVLAVTSIRDVFHNDFWGTPMADAQSHKSYRPLTTLTFRANYIFFGLNFIWFHATNVLLHMLASTLFTRICQKVSGLEQPFSLLAGLMFAAHPIHTEAVTGVVGRADILTCVFFLLSLLSYHGSGTCHLGLSIFSGIMAMLSKEIGITVFFVNVIFDLFRNWPYIIQSTLDVRWHGKTKQFALRILIVFISLGMLFITRISLLQNSLPQFSPEDNPAAFDSSLLVKMMTFSYLSAFNFWLLLCPAHLSHDWQMGSIPMITSILDSRNLLTCFFFASAIIFVYTTTLNSHYHEKNRQQATILGFLLLVIPFLPASNLVITVGFVIAERLLYIPSLGFILLTVNGFQIIWRSFSKNCQTLVSFMVLLLMINTFGCIIRNKDWRSRETLLRAGLKTLPQNAKMHYNFANFLRDSDHYELAISHYHAALRLWPTYASAHNNLGTLMKNETEAEDHFLMAIHYNKYHLNGHFNLGQLYRKMNRTNEAEDMLKQCINIAPNFMPAYTELIHLKGAKDKEVSTLLKKVIRFSGDEYYLLIYAKLLHNKGNLDLALSYYIQTLRISSSNLVGLTGAGRILLQLGKYSRLFQLTTRYQTIRRIQQGDTFGQANIYLQRWYLKFELNRYAIGYDKDLSVQIKCNNRTNAKIAVKNQQISNKLLIHFTS